VHIAIINKAQKRTETTAQLLASSVFLSILLGAVGCSFGIVLFVSINSWFGDLEFDLFLIAICILPIIMMNNAIQAIFQISHARNWYTFSFFGFHAIHMVFSLLGIVYFEYDVYIAIRILLFARILSLGVMLIAAIRLFGVSSQIDFHLVSGLLSIGLKAHFASIITFLASRLDLLMLNSITGASAAGIYFVAYSMMTVLLILPNAVRNIMYQKLADEDNVASQLAITLLMTKITFFFMTMIIAFLIVFSEPLIYLVGGREFEGVREALYFLAPGFACVSIPMVLVTFWHTRDMFSVVNRISVVSLILILATNLILIPRFGITGAALSTSVVFIIGSAIHLGVLGKRFGINVFSKVFLIDGNEFEKLRHYGLFR